MSDVVRDLFDSVSDHRQWAALAPPASTVVRRGQQLRAARQARVRALLVVLVAVLVLGPLLLSDAGWAHGRPAAPVRRPVPSPVPSPLPPPGVDLDQLPVGSPPDAVPYALGRRIYWHGDLYTVPVVHGGPVKVLRTQPLRGDVLAWVRDGTSTVAGIVGPGRSWSELREPVVDVVDGDLVVVDAGVSVVDPFTHETVAELGPTAPGLTVSASTVGAEVLVTYVWIFDRSAASTVLWDPSTGTDTALRAPEDGIGRWTVAQRRAGVLAEPDGVGCVLLHRLPAPFGVGQRLCSERGYELSWDGTRAVVVRGGRLAVVSVAHPERPPVTASLTGLPPAQAEQMRVLRPVAWEDAEHYLALVQLGDQLAMVRCAADRARCERVVTSHTRTGVSEIVAGW